MKITAVHTFFVDPGGAKNWLFVKVETDAGIHGWGECYTQADRDRAIEAHVQQLGRYLVGRDPHQIKHFTFVAYNDFAAKRGAMDFYCVLRQLHHARRRDLREPDPGREWLHSAPNCAGARAGAG